MAIIRLKRAPSRRELRQFGGIWLPLFLCLMGYFLYRRGFGTRAVAVWYGAVGVSLVGYLAPGLMRPIFMGLMVIGFPIGWTVSHLALCAIFYLVLTPIGVIMKLVGHDPLKRRFDRSIGSYWVQYDPSADPDRYFRQL